MRILITGSREWTDRHIIHDALMAEVGPYAVATIVHGACPKGGADEIAGYWARYFNGMTEEPHPPKKNTAEEFKARNQKMVDRGADLCLAFPTDNSRGTWDCVRRAKAAGIPVKIYYQDGGVTSEAEPGRSR
jgi:hypothetical protein